MSALVDWAELAISKLLLQNANVANIGDATGLRGSTVAGVVWISLHTADPGEAGDQTTSEADYTGYARVSVVRSAVGWEENGGNGLQNAAEIAFGQCTVGTNAITHVGIGTDETAAGNLIMKAELTAPLAVSPGITPSFAAGSCDFVLA